MHIVHENISNLKELANFLRLLPNGLYNTPLNFIDGGTIGKHVRHVLEFYISLENYQDGQISYDDRKRDLRLENDVDFVLHTIQQLAENLGKIKADHLLFVKANHSVQKDETSLLASSLNRELGYALDHTTHHLAIVKLILKAENVVLHLPDSFGVAPSTLRSMACAQ